MSKQVTKINSEIIDELIKHYEKPEDLLGEGGILKQLQKAMLERILEGELTTELGYKKHDPKGHHSGNSRNGEFSPQIIPKHQTRFEGFDDKIISLYARGMNTRDIQAQLQELYGVEVSATLVSNVTNEVIDEVKAWQSRPLDKVYPIVYLDALMIKINEDKRVINKAFYLAVGINLDGQKELLGIWVSQNEGAKFWHSVLIELKNRGVEDLCRRSYWLS